jgi:hypothetical protein
MFMLFFVFSNFRAFVIGFENFFTANVRQNAND